MKRPKSLQWSRLDNAGKIFPPTSSRADPKVFRFACELREPVIPVYLQKALDRTIKDFPHFRVSLRKGLFWYFLESNQLKPQIREETLAPCSPIYHSEHKGLLFRVTYYKARINFEVYHALTDGTGALQFLRVLVYHYLLLRHQDEIGENPPRLDYDASLGEKSDDSFQRYYDSTNKEKPPKYVNAYRLSGTRLPEYRMRVIEGEMSASQVVTKAREQGVTVTALLTAALLCSIYRQMTVRDRRKRPISVSVPVNLRKYFQSESARNFFGLIKVSYQFPEGGAELIDVAKAVADCFKQELTPKRLASRMNRLTAIEHNMLARIVPLALKDISLGFAGRYADLQETCSLSNVGQVNMPRELCPYIRLFDVFNSAKYLKLCMVSFEDRMVLTFTSPFVSTDIQKQFFRYLTEMGIDITIRANAPEEEDPDEQEDSDAEM